MKRTLLAVVTAVAFGGLAGCVAPVAGTGKLYQVVGVETDDMLKLRAGPGTDTRVVAGLPNGTILRVHSCEQTGATRWCKASMRGASGLSGYVSWAYLRDI
ncbi:peptide-binding protein [Paracoccus tegillarcae]|uniref:Peptide-binding protein n=2 Tax=Paracoccus tegillarcae TaxID=1529068 RepID=A0A2K9F0W3_9RHOB|nr:SH3 domain-containing protein [Paracoccus tegillarcae]AUH35204.1 peptide-binding protein [Paracoccus tegillarcae]